MAEYALGIICSGKTLGISVVQKSYRKREVRYSHSFPLSSDPHDVESMNKEMADVVKTVMSREKIRKARVSIGVDSTGFCWNSLEMPPVSRDDLRQIVRFELDSHMPVDPEESVFDIQIQESIEGLTNRVTLFVTSRHVTDRLRQLADRAEIALDSVTPVDTALARYVYRHSDTDTANGLKLLLLARDHDYMITLIRDDRFMANRLVSNENPWDQKPIELESAGDNLTEEQIGDLISQNAQLILLMSNEQMAEVGEITCIGKVSDGVVNRLKQVLPGKVVRHIRFDSENLSGSHYAEIASVCLALEQFDINDSVNLLPMELRPVRRDMGRILIGVAAGLLIASMILVGANNYWATELKLLATDVRLASMEHRVNLITDVNLKFASIQEAGNYFRSQNIEYPSHLEVLLETTRLLPSADTEKYKKVWLEQFDIENREMTIRGDSESPESIITILEESPFFEKVRFDGTVAGNRFTIKATLSKLTEGFEDLPEQDPGMSNGEDPIPGDAGTEDAEAMKKPTQPDDAVPETPFESEPVEIEPEDKEIPRARGPAFPRSEPAEAVEPETDFESDFSEPLTPQDQEALGEEAKQEDMEAMKQNLFDFIQERKQAGDLEGDVARDYEEADPEESAANFIEFLKAVAESDKDGE